MMDLEPEVTLPNGQRVLLAIYECVADLQRAGHVVSVDDVGAVHVNPGVHEDCLYMLDHRSADVAAILDNPPAAVH